MTSQPTPYCCWLCGKSVDLTQCKIDEYGKAVHESCYVVRVSLEGVSSEGPRTEAAWSQNSQNRLPHAAPVRL
jgi:hypothetical protein